MILIFRFVLYLGGVFCLYYTSRCSNVSQNSFIFYFNLLTYLSYNAGFECDDSVGALF